MSVFDRLRNTQNLSQVAQHAEVPTEIAVIRNVGFLPVERLFDGVFGTVVTDRFVLDPVFCRMSALFEAGEAAEFPVSDLNLVMIPISGDPSMADAVKCMLVDTFRARADHLYQTQSARVSGILNVRLDAERARLVNAAVAFLDQVGASPKTVPVLVTMRVVRSGHDEDASFRYRVDADDSYVCTLPPDVAIGVSQARAADLTELLASACAEHEGEAEIRFTFQSSVSVPAHDQRVARVAAQQLMNLGFQPEIDTTRCHLIGAEPWEEYQSSTPAGPRP